MVDQALQKTNEFTAQLEKAKRDQLNLLMPSQHIEGLSIFHAPVLETVQLSVDHNDGDVYAHDNEDDPNKKKWRLTKQSLMKLSVCGGVIWSAELSHRIDDGHDRNYIAYQAVGGIRKADGSPIFFKATYDIDFEIIEQELREQYEKKAQYLKKEDGPGKRAATQQEKHEYVEYCVKRDLLQKRKHGLKLVEAGAMNRVIREIFGLKQAYTAKELAKPFAMIRIAFKPDYSDKEVRKAFLDAHIKAMTGIYGPTVTAESTPKETVIDVTPVAKDHEEKEDVTNGKPATPGETPPPTPPTKEMMLFDFSQANHVEKAKAVEIMAGQKGYDLARYLTEGKKKNSTELKDETLGKLFAHLVDMQDKVKEEDDIPFLIRWERD